MLLRKIALLLACGAILVLEACTTAPMAFTSDQSMGPSDRALEEIKAIGYEG